MFNKNLFIDAFCRIKYPAEFVALNLDHARINSIDPYKIKYDLKNGFAIIDGKDSYKINIMVHDTISINELKNIEIIHNNLINECNGSIIKNCLHNISENNIINSKVVVFYFDIQEYNNENEKEYISIRWKSVEEDDVIFAKEFVRIYSDGLITKHSVSELGSYVPRPKEIDEFVYLFQKALFSYL